MVIDTAIIPLEHVAPRFVDSGGRDIPASRVQAVMLPANRRLGASSQRDSSDEKLNKETFARSNVRRLWLMEERDELVFFRLGAFMLLKVVWEVRQTGILPM